MSRPFCITKEGQPGGGIGQSRELSFISCPTFQIKTRPLSGHSFVTCAVEFQSNPSIITAHDELCPGLSVAPSMVSRDEG